VNDASSWSQVGPNFYQATLTCPGGATALSVGVDGDGSLDTVVTMMIVGGQSGLFRVRLLGGSQPADVTAQLVCAQVS
jgi:hypothetical protein